MEVVITSETSVYFNETTWRCIPEDCHLHCLRCLLVSPRYTVAITLIIYDPVSTAGVTRFQDLSHHADNTRTTSQLSGLSEPKTF
jgi:hypothetical protein